MAMCGIADFSSPLEIAFTLSAVFYYIELRKIAEERTTAALTGHDAALNTGIRASLRKRKDDTAEALSMATQTFREEWAAGELGLTLLGIHLVLTNLSRFIPLALKFAVLYINWTVVKSTRYFVHIFAFVSVIASLGSLLYSGYVPDGAIDCSTMTFIIVASYVSIVWNLIVYFIYIPAITRMVKPTGPSKDSSTNVVNVSPTELFTQLRLTIEEKVQAEQERDELLACLAELQRTRGTTLYRDQYMRFIAAAANHMTVVAPFLPALAHIPHP